MPEYVRVKDKDTGHHYTVLQAQVDGNPDAYQVLKQAATNHNGDPLPGEIPETTGQSAGTTKSSSKES